MYYCRNCGATFESGEEMKIKERSEYFGFLAEEENSVCPECGSDDFEESFFCRICEHVFPKSMEDCECVCEECTENIRDELREWIEEHTPEERKVIYEITGDF